MEHGFQKTEMGQQQYLHNLSIIGQSVQRTVYARIMQILVNQRNMLAVFAQRAHHNDLIQAREVSKLAINSFGALQAKTSGLQMVIGAIENMFKAKMLADPDTIVLPHGCLQYMKLCKPEERAFYLCGELARRLEISPERTQTLSIYNNNYQVFEHKPLSVSDDVGNVNMLAREREVGNVFRIFRNPSEEYNNHSAPTAIKVIDHDRQRWATITLAQALAKTEIWNPDVTIKVDQNKTNDENEEFKHLNRRADNPLEGCRVIGDLSKEQLTMSTIRDAVRSLEILLSTANVSRNTDLNENQMKNICANNIWYKNFANITGEISAPIGSNTETSAATASVEELGDALQSAMLEAVVADEPTPEVTEKVNSAVIKAAVSDVVSITTDMTDAQRGSIASALVGAVAGFKNSKSALRKLIRNKDPSKQADLDTTYGEAIRKDVGANWKNINTEAKKIAAMIGMSNEGIADGGDRAKPEGSGIDKFIPMIMSAGFSNVQRRLAKWYLGCSIDLPTLISLDAKGVVIPFGALVWRPTQSFTMGSCIVMRSGLDTGFTAVGNSDFILGDSATNKTHLGHFTFYFEPVVTEANHVCVARDVAFLGYNGGCGVEFYDSYAEFAQQSRRAHGAAPSLLAALAYQHESEEQNRQDPMSMTGAFDNTSILNALNPTSGDNRREHYQTASYYRALMNIEEPGTESLTRDAGDDNFFNVENSNMICYQGLQAERGPDKTFTQYTQNTGHLGDSETIDSSLVWSGMMAMKSSVSDFVFLILTNVRYLITIFQFCIV